MNNEELERCPFCGEKAGISFHDEYRDKVSVGCFSGCGMVVETQYLSRDSAIAAWNRRMIVMPSKDDGPLAWIRLCSDGTYEGPISDQSMDDIRRRSGAWTPLYAAKKEKVSADIPKAMLKLEDSWNQMAKENREAAYFGAAGAYEDCVSDLSFLRTSISSTLSPLGLQGNSVDCSSLISRLQEYEAWHREQSKRYDGDNEHDALASAYNMQIISIQNFANAGDAK